MKRLTLKELELRQAKQREDFLAKQEAAEQAKAAKEAGKAGKNKLEMLERFLGRHELMLDHSVAVFWNGECIGATTAPPHVAQGGEV